MRIVRMWIAVLVTLFALPCAWAQEKQTPPASAPNSAAPAEAFRVQIVLTEYDGTNKIGSLPYTIPVATSNYDPRSVGSLRVGIRIPIMTAAKSGDTSLTYIDVGSNIDVRVKPVDAGRYSLDLTIDRSSVYVREPNKDGKAEGKEWTSGDPVPTHDPLIHEFRGNVSFIVHDGHAAEATVAADPITGHVMKVEATLNVLK